MIGLTVTLVAPAYAPGAPIDDLKAKAASIEDQIAANGAKVAALGEQLNAAQIELDDAREKIADAESRTQAAELQMMRLRAILNERAADIYKSAGTQGPFDAINTDDANDITAQKKYSQLASGRDDAIIDALANAKEELAEQRAAAESAREKAQAQADELASAKAEANAAAAKQRQLLAGVESEISEAERQEQLARERAAAAAAAAARPAAANGGGGSTSAPKAASARGPAYDGPAPSASGGAGAAVAYATAQVGKPYCYAGVGPDCYDCSGLTMMAWRQGGISLPHFSGSQGAMFPRVPLDALAPGDLITTSSWGQHVGIWVGGGFVHATHTGDFIRYVAGNGRVVDAVRPG
jgi:cell wall-associated NlpC family hydrolase